MVKGFSKMAVIPTCLPQQRDKLKPRDEGHLVIAQKQIEGFDLQMKKRVCR